jgi:hypothetical protein
VRGASRAVTRATSRAAARAVTLVAVVGVGLAGGCTSTATTPDTAATAAGASPTGVPLAWPLPADPSAAATKAGLPMLGEEMLKVHYHAHLDVIVRGAVITVPAEIGIDNGRHRISALHTHDATGIVHIESGEDIPFTLGQLFTEWGQPLTANQVGPVTSGHDEQVRVYRNGTAITGDPAALKFTAHDQLVVWLGPASEQPRVRSAYTFPSGE